MGYAYISVDVDIDQVLESLTDKELLDAIPRQAILDYLGIKEGGQIDLSDGAVRLDVILELRKLGYTVEPG